tara:strand:+ start:6329 stop:6547 length:219 start_codon:yes stop_codon:yes gene_type:complete
MLLMTGDVFLLREKYRSNGSNGMGIVIMIESHEGPNFICYDYIVMLDNGNLMRITESCVEEIYTNINQQTFE